MRVAGTLWKIQNKINMQTGFSGDLIDKLNSSLRKLCGKVWNVP